MAVQEDWILRKIEVMIKTLMLIVVGKNGMEEEEINSFKNTNELYIEINKLISDNKICEAEDLIFEVVEENKSKSNIIAAILFYKEINKLSNEKLKENNFSRNEVKTGLDDLTELVMN